MKLKRLLMMAFVAMELAAMTSCTKDNSELILGTWEETTGSYVHFTRNGNDIPVGRSYWSTYTFNENGTVTHTRHDKFNEYPDKTYTYSYSVNGDTLRFGGGETEGGSTYAIKQLDEKKLIFEWYRNETREEYDGTNTYVYIDHIDCDRK